MRRIFPFLLSLALVASALIQPRTASAEGRTPLRLTSEDLGAARRAFTDLLVESNRGGQRLIGMPGPDEQARAGLGAPLPVAMIRLDRLRAYQPGAPIDNLIDHLGVVLYAVQVDRDVRAELEFDRQSGTWQAVRVGASGHARELARLSKLAGAPNYLLRVPALGVEFLAYGSGDALRLLLVHATPGVELQAQKPLPAQDVLRVLSPLARAYRDPITR
jgi:hypothetical protein